MFKSFYRDQISCVSSAVVKTIKVILKSDMVLGQAIAPPFISGIMIATKDRITQ